MRFDAMYEVKKEGKDDYVKPHRTTWSTIASLGVSNPMVVGVFMNPMTGVFLYQRVQSFLAFS
jgi:hypothetical protein